jgi:hypothetical protein
MWRNSIWLTSKLKRARAAGRRLSSRWRERAEAAETESAHLAEALRGCLMFHAHPDIHGQAVEAAQGLLGAYDRRKRYTDTEGRDG